MSTVANRRTTNKTAKARRNATPEDHAVEYGSSASIRLLPTFKYIGRHRQLRSVRGVNRIDAHVWRPSDPRWRDGCHGPPKNWPKTWKWPCDVMRCREHDGPCLQCGCRPKTTCKCDPVSWRDSIDWTRDQEIFTTSDAGLGVRSMRSWSKGEVLGDYVGLVRPWERETESKYALPVTMQGYRCTSYVAIIDSEKIGNWTRFVNHWGCRPNVRLTFRRVGAERVVAAIATRDIEAGEELRINYGERCDLDGGSRRLDCEPWDGGLRRRTRTSETLMSRSKRIPRLTIQQQNKSYKI